MVAHLHPLVSIQWAGLCQNGVADTYLSDVVQPSGGRGPLLADLSESEASANRRAPLRDHRGVLAVAEHAIDLVSQPDEGGRYFPFQVMIRRGWPIRPDNAVTSTSFGPVQRSVGGVEQLVGIDRGWSLPVDRGDAQRGGEPHPVGPIGKRHRWRADS